MILYAEDHFDKIESKQDNCRPYGQGQDGYGRKIASRYLVRFNGKGPWRRCYITQISNAGSIWVKVKDTTYHFRIDENLRTQGEWPK
jgi:hypothetical protein